MATVALSNFSKYVAPDVLGCPVPLLERELMSAIIEFCKRTNILSKHFDHAIDTTYIETDEALDYYDVDLTEYITDLRPVALEELWVDGTQWDIEERDIQGDVTDWTSIREDGVKYFSFPNNNTLRIFDMNNGESNLYIVMSFKPLRANTTVDEVLLEDWLDVIIAGTKHRLLAMPGKDWSDPKNAQYWFVQWRRGVSQARAQHERGHTGKAQRVNWQSFED